MFTQGEFVFTTLGFAGVHPDLAEEALLALIECGVAAVAVKPVVLKELPPSVVQASAARGVPVFFYEGRYMERVIADLMNLLDDDAAEWERNHLIDLILAPSDEHAVRSTFFTIAGVTGATIQCLTIRPVTDDGASLRALQKVVERVLTGYGERWDDVERNFLLLPRDASGVRLLQKASAEGCCHLRRRPGEMHRHGRAFGVRHQPGGEPGGGGSGGAAGHGRPAHGRGW